MSDYYCTHCGADLVNQPGFDPDVGYWTCTECGQFLIDPEDESGEPSRFDAVGWFCDGCGAYLNKQSGFSDWYSTWTCTECGYINNLSEDEIYESEEAYQASRKEEDPEENDDGDDEYDCGEEWQYDHPRRCECCDCLLNKQEGFEEWLGYFTCEKCGYFNEWSTDDNNEEESYFDSDEYKRQIQTEASRKEDQERKQEELRRAKESGRLQKQEKRREQRKRLWRTITGKKQIIGLSSEQCQHMRYEDVISILRNQEFYNINVSRCEDLLPESIALEGIIGQISINGMTAFDASVQVPFNAKIHIVYHMLKTAVPPLTSRSAMHMSIDEVAWKFTKVGFMNIHREAIPDLITGWLVKKYSVEKVAIDGRTDFKKSDRFRLDAKIVISYHVFKNGR